MRERCEKSYCKDYTRYGGRGIKVCARWQIFANFAVDMGERPEGMTLDRIDNDGNYSPENCRWVSRKEQTHNSSVAKLTREEAILIREKYLEGKLNQADIAEAFNVHQSVISRIVNNKIW